MTDFEFLSVLVSIVIGLGLTHLLSGLGRAFYLRELNRMDAVHVAWTITLLFVLVLNWWVFLLWREFEPWTFPVYFTVLVWTMSFYMLVLALYPPNLPEDVDYRALFERNRSWFLGTFAAMTLLDLTVTTQRENQLPEPFYIAFVGHYTLITFLGMFLRNRGYDLVLAWYMTITMAAWSFGVRYTLG